MSSVTTSLYTLGDKIDINNRCNGIVGLDDISGNKLFVSDVNGTFVEGNDIQTYG